MLTNAEIFACGALGAFVALLVVQVLPLAFRLTYEQMELTVTPIRLLGAFAILATFLLCGGVVALLLAGDDGTTIKNAIVYGLGWQGSIGGFLAGVRPQVEPLAEGDAVSPRG